MSIFRPFTFMLTAGAVALLAAPHGDAVPVDPVHRHGESLMAGEPGGQPNSQPAPSFGSSTDPSLSRKLNDSGGVIQPPKGVDPEFSQMPPKVDPRSTPVVPPAVPPDAPK